MRLTTYAACYIFLAVTISVSCTKTDKQNEAEISQPNRSIQKRDTTLLIDNFPVERTFHKPKTIYRRFSKHRYVHPKSIYGSPKPKYGPKSRRSPPKKYRPKPHLPKRSLSNHSSKPRYTPPYKSSPKPRYNTPRRAPSFTNNIPLNSNFAEPPMAYDYRPPKQSYAEPPVGPFGEALKPVVEDIYPSAPSYPTTHSHLENQNFNLGHQYQSWKEYAPGRNTDSLYEHSNKVPIVTKPEAPIFVTPATDYNDDDSIETEPTKPKQNGFTPKKKQFYGGNSKIVKQPWRLNKKPKGDHEIIVGGQYAEPPGRFVQKLEASAPMYEDDGFLPPVQFDMVPSSASSSPYVNYKNSNMAFSPQNLNDAFSIVDK